MPPTPPAAPGPGTAPAPAPRGAALPPVDDAGPGGLAAAVTALPALPPPDPAGSRYGVHRLTAAWLAEMRPHTRRAYFRDLADFLAWCQRAGVDPCTARPADLAEYRAWLAERPVQPPAPSTVHRRLSALSSWYRYLVANGDTVATNPVTGVRRPRVERDASTTAGLTLEEVRALLARADTVVARRARDGQHSAGGRAHRRRYLAALRDRALVRMLADLGLRVGEVLALPVDALSYNRGRRTVQFVAKGGRRRERPLTPQVCEALDDYLAARAREAGVAASALTGPLLASTRRDGSPGSLAEPAVFRLVRRLAAEAGIASADRLSPHSLRHAFATNARDLGVPLEDVQDAMGHADARTTRRYDRARHALHRDPALRLGDAYEQR